MKGTLPRTPFSTPLSGSARELRLRLINIFQWKKRRPPLPLLCLCLAAALLCGGLAACQSQPAPQTGSASSESSSVTSSRSPERLILEALSPYAQGLEEDSKTSISYLLQEDEDRYFGAGRYSSGERYSLVIGLVNPDGTVAGAPFETGAYGGRPYLQTFWKDEQKYLLYTATGMQTGLSWGEAGLIRLDEDDFTWVWPVEGDIRDKQSAAYAEYQDYWTGRLPLMAPGGVEVFVDSGYDVLQGEGPQWVPDHNEQFFPSDYDQLPIPVPYQVRVWLEEYTAQPDGNPWRMNNASAAWQITSLKADETRYPDQKDTEQAYTLEARAENGYGETLTATLLFDQAEGKVTRAVEVLWGGDDFGLDISSLQSERFTYQEAPAILEKLNLEDFPTRPVDLLDCWTRKTGRARKTGRRWSIFSGRTRPRTPPSMGLWREHAPTPMCPTPLSASSSATGQIGASTPWTGRETSGRGWPRSSLWGTSTATEPRRPPCPFSPATAPDATPTACPFLIWTPWSALSLTAPASPSPQSLTRRPTRRSWIPGNSKPS